MNCRYTYKLFLIIISFPYFCQNSINHQQFPLMTCISPFLLAPTFFLVSYQYSQLLLVVLVVIFSFSHLSVCSFLLIAQKYLPFLLCLEIFFFSSRSQKYFSFFLVFRNNFFLLIAQEYLSFSFLCLEIIFFSSRCLEISFFLLIAQKYFSYFFVAQK